MTRSDFEIMAPVGSFESLHAAISAGADAIYFGVQGTKHALTLKRQLLNRRPPDNNRHLQPGRSKTYLTVNTIIYDSDMQPLLDTLDAAAQAGVSAVIASDIAAITEARKRNIEVHISTQCNISNTAAVRYYAQWADTVVLARELNLDQVAAIHNAITTEPILGPSGQPVKIEMFCHGALCMAVSGKCYLSLHSLNSSANRGACAQICRRSYTVTDRETGESLDIENKYIMSPKDLKTIHFLNKMADAGVRVFKIEGRARGAEYVYTAVKAYNTALNAICDGTYTPTLIDNIETDLAKIFTEATGTATTSDNA